MDASHRFALTILVPLAVGACKPLPQPTPEDEAFAQKAATAVIEGDGPEFLPMLTPGFRGKLPPAVLAAVFRRHAKNCPTPPDARVTKSTVIIRSSKPNYLEYELTFAHSKGETVVEIKFWKENGERSIDEFATAC